MQKILLLKIKKVEHRLVHPPHDRAEEFGWIFSNDDKYIIKWFERPVATRVLDVTISEDTGPSI